MTMPVELVTLLKRGVRQPVIGTPIGVIDYLMFPKRGVAWGGPFNGQTARQALFRDIVANTWPKAIVETGTYFGTTTAFMAESGLPVFTIEVHPRRYGFVRARFWRKPNVKLFRGDSRTILRKLFDGPLHALSSGTLFFYLDAHWGDDLPLVGEVDMVFNRCPSAVVMIDDFRVPTDDGYHYDDYGPGRTLVSDYIRPAVLAHRLQAFYPSTASAAESGERRGCVVLAKETSHGRILTSIPLLSYADESEQ
jgi:hypothetical protein